MSNQIGNDSNGDIVLGNYVFHTNSKHKFTPSFVFVDCLNETKNPDVNYIGRLIHLNEIHTYLQREGYVYKILKSYPHPCIQNIHAIIEPTENSPGAIVIQIPKKNLFSFIHENNVLPEHIIMKYFNTIVSIVEHCHIHHIILREIRLSSFYLTLDETDVIFYDLNGSCVVNMNEPLLQEIFGGTIYISPEILSFRPYDSISSNMWALGIILYTMLTKKIPFIFTNGHELVNMILSSVIPYPTHLSKYSIDILKSLLNRNPLARPTTNVLLNKIKLLMN